MRHVRLFKRAPFRLALLCAALVLIAYLAGALLAAHYLENDLSSRLDVLVKERYTTISEEYTNGDRAAFIELVRHHANATSSRSILYQLRNSEGQLLAGNVTTELSEKEGLSTHEGPIGTGDHDSRYRLLTGRIENRELPRPHHRPAAAGYPGCGAGTARRPSVVPDPAAADDPRMITKTG
jgi:hypothetical protein